MPRRQLARAGLLDQDMLMEEPRGARAHQLTGNFRGGAPEDEVAVFRNPSPIAVVADEPPGAAAGRIDALIGPRFPEIAIDAGSERLDPFPEQAPEKNRAPPGDRPDPHPGKHRRLPTPPPTPH